MTNTNMEQQQSSYKEKERIDLREPRRFKVTIFNDDFTTMEFVVKILTTVFFKSTMIVVVPYWYLSYVLMAQR